VIISAIDEPSSIESE